MIHRTLFIASFLTISLGVTLASGQLYWDLNGTTAGSTDNAPDASGIWDAVTATWNDAADGTGPTHAWTPDAAAVFSAGSDASGGTYVVTLSGTQSASGVTFEDGNDVTLSGGQLTLTGAATVHVANGSGVGRITSAIGGAAGLNSTGPGVLELGGTANASNYTGATTIAASNTLKLIAANVIPDSSVLTLPTTATSGASFQLNGFNETVGSLSGGNATGPPIIALGSSTLTLASPAGETFSGLFTSSAGGKVVKNGSGSITLTGQSGGFSAGEFVLNNGNVAIGNVNIFGTNANGSKLTINGGSFTNSAPATGRSMSVANIDIGGSFAYNGTGAANVEWLGVASSGEGTAVVTLKVANPTITVSSTSTGTFIFRGPVGDGGNGYGFTKDGNGVLTLNHPGSTYGGATTILAGELRIDANATLGNGSGALNLSGGALKVTATRAVATDPVPNPINVTADSAILTSAGAATVDVDFTTNALGGSGGTLTLRNDAAAGTGQFEPRFSGSGFDFARPIVIDTGLNGATRTTRMNSANAASTTQTFSGPISGAGSYRRLAGGTTVFSGANSFTGGVTVEGGTLTASGAAATLGAGNVTVTGGNISISSGVTNAIADTATLSLLGGGTAGVADIAFADLGAGINERVAALLLNGAPQANGTYGSAASSATFKLDEYFTGSGILTVGPAGVPGDYNGNGIVDGADYVLWRKGGPLQNEVDNPGTVNAADYDAWRARFGNTSGSGSELESGAAVPEPSAVLMVMLMLGSTLLAGYRRDR